METRANFLLIGLFIAVSLILGVRFAVFIESAAWIADRVYYELAFSNAGANITPGVPINFNGVKVGEIVEAPLSRDASLAIMLAKIDRSAPIRTNTKAKVELSNLMGAAVISLEGVAGDAPALAPAPGRPYPRIMVENSVGLGLNFDDVNARFAKLSETARETLGGIPSELSQIKWELDSVIEVMRPLMQDQGPKAAAGAAAPAPINIQTLERAVDKFGAMVEASRRFLEANSLAELETKSIKAKEMSGADLEKLKALAVELRKKVTIFEQKIRDMGLTDTAR